LLNLDDETMQNLGGDSYQANITLDPSNQNYTYNVWANDTLGNSGQSINQTFSALWDCTWNFSSNLEASAGWDENKGIGNITLFNTGDQNYPEGNNCTLGHRLSHNLGAGRVYFNNWRYNLEEVTYNSEEISPGENTTVLVNFSFEKDRIEETLNITVEDRLQTSNLSSDTTSILLVTNQEGPYLYQEVSSSPDTVYLVDEGFSIEGIVQNLMGSPTYNETNAAFNVTLNWSLPEVLSISEGNLSNSFDNVSTKGSNYNILNLSFTDLETMSPGERLFTLSSSGFDSSNEAIRDANDLSVLTDSVNITFLCYNESDGICVTGCGYTQDSDCEQEVVTIGGGSSGGSGGGGGGSSGDEFDKSEGIFELLNGEDSKFFFELENKQNKTRTVTDIFVKGENAAYIDILEGVGEKLSGGEKINITVEINAPAYFDSGKHLLQFDVVLKDAAGTSETLQKYMTLFILDVPREVADEMVLSAEEYLAWMKENELKMSVVNNYFSEMEANYLAVEFTTLKNNFEKLEEVASAAQEFVEINSTLLEQINHAKEFDIDVFETRKLWLLANVIFNRGDYILAKQRINEAQSMYSYETKGEFGLWYYTQKNPVQALSALIVVLGVGLFGGFMSRKMYLRRKINLLTKEEKLLLQLMELIQGYTFKDNKMSMGEYYEAMGQYEKKLSETISSRIKTEAQLASLTSLRSKKDALLLEKKRLIEMMRELQDDYLNKGTMDTRIYENMLKTYAKRLTTVQEQAVYLETRGMLKKKNLMKGAKIPN